MLRDFVVSNLPDNLDIDRVPNISLHLPLVSVQNVGSSDCSHLVIYLAIPDLDLPSRRLWSLQVHFSDIEEGRLDRHFY